MKLTCPTCHTIFHLEAAMEEAAGREFAAYIVNLGEFARPLVAYLGMFRPASRALAYERMLRMAREVMALSQDAGQLAKALSETVESLRQKRDEGDIRPLKNHNYLKRVLENTPNVGTALAPAAMQNVQGSAPTSKTARAIGRLQGRKSS